MMSHWLAEKLKSMPNLPIVISVIAHGEYVECISINMVERIEPSCKCDDCQEGKNKPHIEIEMD